MEEFIAKKNLCPYVTGEEVLCEKTVACKGCEYCPDTDDDWESLGEKAQYLTEKEIEELRNESYWKGHIHGYNECEAEFMEGFGDIDDLSDEQLQAWRAGYRECKLNNVDLGTLTISPIFLEYIYKIRNLVMDLRNKADDKEFSLYLLDISKELSEMTQYVIMEKVYEYWEYK